VDYNKLSDEEILRKDLREKYPTLSDKALQLLYKEQVVDRYKLDPDRYDELETELGKELMAAEAANKRVGYIDKQNQFRGPELQPQAPQVDEKFIQQLQSDPVTQKLMADKNVIIDFNGEQFSYEVDNAQAMMEMTMDNTKFFNLFAKPEGGVDLNKWYRVLNYASSMEVFEKSLIAHGKALGEADVINRRKNPSTPAPTGINSNQSDANEFKSGLLQAFATQGRHIN
jgi:hypothetical protein